MLKPDFTMYSGGVCVGSGGGGQSRRCWSCTDRMWDCRD